MERPVCRSAPPPFMVGFVEWHHVRPTRIPFIRTFRSVGLQPLRGGNGTQAVPYKMDEPYAVQPTAKQQFIVCWMMHKKTRRERTAVHSRLGVFFVTGSEYS